MQAARQCIRALIEETRGMKGTKEDMEIVMNRLDALEDILDRAQVSDMAAGVRVSHLRYWQILSFSSVEQSHLIAIGLQQKPLHLNQEALNARILASSISLKHIKKLCKQITRIHRSVSKRVSHFSSSCIC
jgi:hypothetical protein